MNGCVLVLQVLLTSDTEEGEEEDEDACEDGAVPHVHYSGGALRPSWVAA